MPSSSGLSKFTEPELLLEIVLVVASGPRSVQERRVVVESGTTASQALQQFSIAETLSQAQLQNMSIAVWGRNVTGSYVLRADDRLELVRPLSVDPKVARRERFAHQGAKKAGLFKSRRAGGKAGY